MKRLLLLLLICCQTATLSAQKKAPKWMDKARGALLTVTTYKKDNTELHKGVGFFVSESGEALSAYSLFKEAHRATVTDGEGKSYPISLILGADEMYDVIRFRVEAPRKITYLKTTSMPLQVGTPTYLMPPSDGKEPLFKEGQITEVTKLKDSYNYYKVSFPLETWQSNAPMLNANGEVFGLAQDDASGKNACSYAVSAGYAASLALTSADALSTTYRAIGIRKAWPAEADQALVMLYFMSGNQDAKEYLVTLTDFINTFPNSTEGYLNRSNHYAYHRTELAATAAEQNALLDQALADITTAGKYTERKGDPFFNRAKLMYSLSADSTFSHPKFTIEAAEAELMEAIRTDDQPHYHQLLGDIHFGRSQFEEAYAQYILATASPTASPASFYMAAKSRQQFPAANFGELIMLLDSAVSRSGVVPSPEAATYVLERVDLRMKLMQYKEAVEDYDRYFILMGGNVSATFYFYREQAKFRLGDLEGALADIQEAIRRSPEDADYRAEEASVYVRMQAYDKALLSLDEALRLQPEYAACYRLKGVTLVRMQKKTEACTAFAKAKELGDPLADKLIQEHCK